MQSSTIEFMAAAKHRLRTPCGGRSDAQSPLQLSLCAGEGACLGGVPNDLWSG